MKISRQTRDRLIAAASAMLVVVLIVGTVLIAKSCQKCEVTYFDGENVLKVENVEKGEKAHNWRPDDAESHRIFDCWVTEDGEEYDFGDPVEDDLKLYAKWDE